MRRNLQKLQKLLTKFQTFAVVSQLSLKSSKVTRGGGANRHLTRKITSNSYSPTLCVQQMPSFDKKNASQITNTWKLSTHLRKFLATYRYTAPHSNVVGLLHESLSENLRLTPSPISLLKLFESRKRRGSMLKWKKEQNFSTRMLTGFPKKKGLRKKRPQKMRQE